LTLWPASALQVGAQLLKIAETHLSLPVDLARLGGLVLNLDVLLAELELVIP
jgi:hypothetical protein